MDEEKKDPEINPSDLNGTSPKSELEECKQKCEEYLNNWKRERADALNYQKSETERWNSWAANAQEYFLLRLLPILDTFSLAEKHMSESIKKDAWSEGFFQIKKQMVDFLKQEGVEEIKTEGKTFDPHFMEAMGEVEGSGESGIVVEELQKGYIAMMTGNVIRPAKVKVTK